VLRGRARAAPQMPIPRVGQTAHSSATAVTVLLAFDRRRGSLDSGRMLRRSVPLAILLFALPSFAFAAQSQTPRATAKPDAFRAQFQSDVDDLESKIVALATAIPADKYSWRPAKGVRSISEVYMHIAGGNYFLSTFVGVEAPQTTGDIEKNVTKKADVIAEMRKSFVHLRNAASGVKDLDATVKMFGKDTTYQGVLVTMLNHLHEHLGQSIAYARINGVVPPWSVPE
jgi:uncharacterized damage-inducible protein DinB